MYNHRQALFSMFYLPDFLQVELSKEHEGDIGARVRLGQHRCGRLNQNIVLRHAGAFRSDVHIHDSTVGRNQVGLLLAHFLAGETQPRHRRSVVCPQGGYVLNRLRKDAHRDVAQIDRCSLVGRREGDVPGDGCVGVSGRRICGAAVGAYMSSTGCGDGCASGGAPAPRGQFMPSFDFDFSDGMRQSSWASTIE